MRKESVHLEEERTDICKNCEHYCIHFIYDRETGQFVAINYGHCMYPRNKIRKINESCEHFTERQE